MLLVAIILTIGLGPRVRIPGLLERAVDLRFQDFLLPVALLYLGPRLVSLRRVWGWSGIAFMVASVAALAGRLLLAPDFPMLRSVAFFGRALEPFLLAAAVAGLYRLSGRRARSVALGALYVTVAGNFLWVAYQFMTGTQQTLLGTSVAELLVAYGPKLVGEGSAFGTGFFFVFATALGVAAYRLPSISRWTSGPVIFAGVAGTYLSGSRLSLVGAAVCLVVAVWSPRVGGKPNLFAALGATAAAILLLPLVPDVGRLSEAGFESGVAVRVERIWAPLARIAWDNLLLGIGPGQLGTQAYPWPEAHNVVLRAVLDYGATIGALFLASLVLVMVRAGRRAVCREASPTQQLWGGATALVIACAFVGGMVQETLTVVMSTHLIGLIVGLYVGSMVSEVREPGAAATDDRADALLPVHS